MPLDADRDMSRGLIAELLDPRRYPHRVDHIELVEMRVSRLHHPAPPPVLLR